MKMPADACPLCGHSAWEILFRYSGITIADTVFDGGYADPTKSAGGATSLTAGLNWYPNANVRLLLDYVHTSFTRGAQVWTRTASRSCSARAVV